MKKHDTIDRPLHNRGALFFVVSALLVAGVALIMVSLTRQPASVRVETGVLRELYTTWAKSGRPADFDPSSYATSTVTSYFTHTNQYRDRNGYISGLVGASSPRFSKRGILMIDREGSVYWIDAGEATLLYTGNSKTQKWVSPAD
jgi:hypothetical protein